MSESLIKDFNLIFEVTPTIIKEQSGAKAYMPYVPDCPGQSQILILCPGVPEIMKLSRKLKKKSQRIF